MTGTALVLNPAKTTNPDGLLDLLNRRCAELGRPAPVVYETSPDDPGAGPARQAVRAGAQVVLAAGGDGTVRAVADALAGTGVPLAVIPQGTGNLLARNLDLPIDPAEAVELALTGPRRSIDLGYLDDSERMTFTVMAGIGFDAAMMRESPEPLKAAVGWPAYLVGGIRGLRQRRIRVSISLDGRPAVRQRVRTVLVGNVGRLQGGLRVLPQAQPDDGVLDIGVIAPRRALDWLILLALVLRGRPGPDRRWRVLRARQVLVRAETAQPRQLDGELIGDGVELRVGIRPGALTVCAPGGSAN